MTRRAKVITAVFAILLLFWFIVNPLGKFGFSFFGYSTFNAVPRPISDFQVSFSGEVRGISKTHDLKLSHVQWLLDENPQVLIIAKGWNGVVSISEEIKKIKNIEIHFLNSGEALKKFNELKEKGIKVSIHFHSTC